MRQGALIAALLAGVCGTANAQPGTLPATELEKFTRHRIGNGLITAQVYPPGDNQLYRGTRFDHAGQVFHITYKGQDFSTYWFDRFTIDPRDAGKQPPGTEGACCATSGPVEVTTAAGSSAGFTGGMVLAATHTCRGRMIDESIPTTSSRPVITERHHCRLMFSLSSTPSGP